MHLIYSKQHYRDDDDWFSELKWFIVYVIWRDGITIDVEERWSTLCSFTKSEVGTLFSKQHPENIEPDGVPTVLYIMVNIHNYVALAGPSDVKHHINIALLIVT